MLGVRQFAASLHEIYSPGGCPNQPCIYGQGEETDGDHAAYFVYAAGSGDANGPGAAGCFIYLYSDTSGWHYLNGRCTQNTSAALGSPDNVRAPGSCANLRDSPGLSTRVIRCLPDGTQVTIDQGPTWRDGHLWWHVAEGGWVAHDFL